MRMSRGALWRKLLTKSKMTSWLLWVSTAPAALALAAEIKFVTGRKFHC